MFRFVFVALVAVIAVAHASHNCAILGGQCLDKFRCPEDLARPDEGLCDPGAVCCFGYDVTDTTCRSHGGECMNAKCNENLVYHGATDCKQGEKCCILV